MGSVVNEIDCNRCGSDNGFEDFNYKSGETTFFCKSCGCYESHMLKRNEDRTLFLKNPKRGYGDFNCVWIHDKNYNTLGAYNINLYDRGGIIDSLLNEEDVKEIKEEFYSNDRYKELTITKFINGKITTDKYTK